MELQEHAITSQTPAGPCRLWRVVFWLLLAASVIYFTWCGPVRGIRESGDLTVGYSAGQAWLAGEDPYQPAMLMKHLAQAGAQEFATPDYVGFMRNIYLPTTLPLYSPVGVFPWTVARSVWVGLGTVSLLVCVAGIMQLAGVRWGSTPGLGLMALSLALAPVHTAFGLGQVSVIALGSLMAAVMLEQRGRAGWAGLFYGLATIAKVQIGLPFVLYVLWRQRWRGGNHCLGVGGRGYVAVGRADGGGGGTVVRVIAGQPAVHIHGPGIQRRDPRQRWAIYVG